MIERFVGWRRGVGRMRISPAAIRHRVPGSLSPS
jgi:hypothetical protein